MKKSIIAFALLAGLFTAQAQEKKSSFLDKVKLEAGWGLNVPTAPNEGISRMDYSGVGSFYVGANYELNTLWGMRGTYAYNKFEDKNDSSFGSTHHKLMAEATYNIIRSIQDNGQQPFELFGHAGFGLTFGSSELVSGTDMMGTFQVGVLPTYHVSNRISIQLDAACVVNFNQDYGYHGGPAKLNGKSTTGSYFVANIGVAVQL